MFALYFIILLHNINYYQIICIYFYSKQYRRRSVMHIHKKCKLVNAKNKITHIYIHLSQAAYCNKHIVCKTIIYGQYFAQIFPKQKLIMLLLI